MDERERARARVQPLLGFLEASLRRRFGANAWITYGPMEIYVRRGLHIIDGSIVDTFDIGSVTVSEQFQGKGLFTQFLREVLRALAVPRLRNSVKGIYVESVLNERFGRWLLSNGFKEVSPNVIPPNYIMWLPPLVSAVLAEKAEEGAGEER